jgi:hypothetical protein
MIRTLQILGVSALICSGAVFLQFTDQWLKEESATEPKPPVIERFRQSGGDGAGGRKTVSPLVEQARFFASYLSPPERPKSKQEIRVASTAKMKTTPVKLPETTAKFTLVATSYYGARPEKSLALVSEPGRENRWVRPGERLGRFVIERIERGAIVYRDGDRSGQMAVGAKITDRRQGTPQRKLASGGTEATENEPSAPRKPQKIRRRRPMQRLGPERPESQLLAHDHVRANG